MTDESQRIFDALIQWQLEVASTWGTVIFVTDPSWPPKFSKAYWKDEKVSEFKWDGEKRSER